MPRHLAIAGLLACAACSGTGSSTDAGADAGLKIVTEDGVDLPLKRATDAERAAFVTGDNLFGQTFLPADGLGPVYVRTSCESCHQKGGRGPGSVEKMALLLPDGGVDPDQSALTWGHTVRPYFTAGDGGLLPPADGGWPEGDTLLLTQRFAPPVLGRGYLEAIADSQIEQQESMQADRPDGIHGRVNRVAYHSEWNGDAGFEDFVFGETGLIGRFGLKARQPALDDFVADAFQGDMGLTSPLRPDELPNPVGTDDGKPGVDMDLDTVNAIASYMRLIEIPDRDPAKVTSAGAALFDQARCSACHVPAMHTRADYPIPALADIDAPVYTDLLLHDLGPAFDDGLTDESARASEWKTAPLIGLRFMKTYLHDGRAHSVQEAIEAHGGQAQVSADLFHTLSDADRQTLVEFVTAL